MFLSWSRFSETWWGLFSVISSQLRTICCELCMFRLKVIGDQASGKVQLNFDDTTTMTWRQCGCTTVALTVHMRLLNVPLNTLSLSSFIVSCRCCCTTPGWQQAMTTHSMLVLPSSYYSAWLMYWQSVICGRQASVNTVTMDYCGCLSSTLVTHRFWLFFCSHA